MNAVIEIPDELYQKVTARVAALGRRMPELTVELYERWLADAQADPVPKPASVQWLEEWFRAADEAISLAPAELSAREILLQDRNRLDQP